MSMQPAFQDSNWNPFLGASHVLDTIKNMGVARTNLQSALAHSAFQHQSMKDLAQHQYSLNESSADAAHNRDLSKQRLQHRQTKEIFHMAHNVAKTGGSVKVGNVSMSLPIPATAPVAPKKPGRVPVKKVRGGKKTP